MSFGTSFPHTGTFAFDDPPIMRLGHLSQKIGLWYTSLSSLWGVDLWTNYQDVRASLT